MSVIPITVVFQEVKGHQDCNHAFDMLDHPSQLNVYADADAKQYLPHLIEETGHYESSTCFQEIFKEGWSC